MKMSRRALIIAIVIVAVVVIAGVVGYFLYNNYEYYSTDDALVTGQIINVQPTVTGTLQSLTVNVGDYVSARQIVGTVKVYGSPAIANVTAPFDGVIVQVPGAIGQFVNPQITVAQETDPATIYITAYVDESAINNIVIRQPVDIHVDAYGGVDYKGHVKRIINASAAQFSLLPTQDNASGNFTKVSQRVPVYIGLDGSPTQALLPGMSAVVTIHLHPSAGE